MVTKKKTQGAGTKTRGKVKIGKLKLNKETVKDLTGSEAKKIKGGYIQGAKKTAHTCSPAPTC